MEQNALKSVNKRNAQIRHLCIKMTVSSCHRHSMEQHALKNVNNCLNAIISYYLKASGGQRSNIYLNVVHFFQHQC
jgi:hypothetical protein